MNNSILNSPDALEALRQRKRTIKKKLKASHEQMEETANYLTGGSYTKAATKAQGIARFIVNGLVIYRGFRLCSGIATSLHSLFSPRSRRR